MTAVLWASVIAVAGTLLGGVVTAALQAWVARTARRETQVAGQRGEALRAVAALLSAVAIHRARRWEREELRLAGVGQQVQTRARERARASRSAITEPLAMVCILTPVLAEAAEAAVQATYVMRHVADLATLEQLRTASLGAEKQLRQAASGVFAPEGGGR